MRFPFDRELAAFAGAPDRFTAIALRIRLPADFPLPDCRSTRGKAFRFPRIARRKHFFGNTKPKRSANPPFLAFFSWNGVPHARPRGMRQR